MGFGVASILLLFIFAQGIDRTVWQEVRLKRKKAARNSEWRWLLGMESGDIRS